MGLRGKDLYDKWNNIAPYHLAQKYRLSKTRLLFIVVISHKKLYISAQIFSISSYGTIYPLYSIGKIKMKDSYTIL